jgi:hypothetical protein
MDTATDCQLVFVVVCFDHDAPKFEEVYIYPYKLPLVETTTWYCPEPDIATDCQFDVGVVCFDHDTPKLEEVYM